MFFHYYKYRVISMLHMKEFMWWNLLFPVLLATLFYAGFSGMMDGKETAFDPIPVAVVTENENQTFTDVLDELSETDDDQLFIQTKTNQSNAEELLKNKEVSAIIYVKKEPSITVAEEGILQSITQSFVTQYLTQADTIETIIKDHPEKLQAAIDQLSEDVTYNQNRTLTNASFDPYKRFFYVLIAMTCLYSTTVGSECISAMQANISPLGMRREASPQHKFTTLISDFLGTLTIQFLSIIILVFYMIVVLGIDLGTKIPFILLTGFAGTLAGISFGVFFGSIIKSNMNVKSSVDMTFSMLCSFLAGLMVPSIKDSIEHTCPIINRINPAAVISDSLCSLNLYDTYTRFGRSILILVGMSVVLCLISYLIIRRNKYASL